MIDLYWPPSRETLYTIGGICVVCGTGLSKLHKQRRRLKQRRAFAGEFRARFSTYVASGGQDFITYTWLIANSPQMQGEMESYGIYGHFRNARHAYTNYPIIMNMLPEIRRRFDNIQRYGGLFQEELRTYFHMIDEAIIRYIGYLDYALAHSPSLLNPAIWFREGIQAWVAGPLTLLNWFGVLSAATVSQVTNHRAFKAFAGAAGAISLISGIFTIALGWGDMHKLISKWLGI